MDILELLLSDLKAGLQGGGGRWRGEECKRKGKKTVLIKIETLVHPLDTKIVPMLCFKDLNFIHFIWNEFYRAMICDVTY